MTIRQQVRECLAAAEQDLSPDESIVQFRLADPQMSRADYIMRFKAFVAVLNPSSTASESKRCFLVTKSSNTGAIAIDKITDCNSISDVW